MMGPIAKDLETHLATAVQELMDRHLKLASLACSSSEILQMMAHIGIGIVVAAMGAAAAAAKPGADEAVAKLIAEMAKAAIDRLQGPVLAKVRAEAVG